MQSGFSKSRVGIGVGRGGVDLKKSGSRSGYWLKAAKIELSSLQGDFYIYLLSALMLPGPQNHYLLRRDFSKHQTSAEIPWH